MILVYHALAFISFHKMHADCLHIWSKFDSFMTSAPSKSPVMGRITSENFRSRTREDIVESPPEIKWKETISPFANILRIVI